MKHILKIVGLIFMASYIQLAKADGYNLILLPDPYCTQAGLEKKLSERYSLGAIGRFNCDSNRPTYGSENDEVENSFSRVFFPLKYSFNNAFSNGPFIQGMIGIENSNFSSSLGSTAEVTFLNFGLYGGYQWYFSNGFNISLLGGIAHLQKIESDQKLSNNETSSVSGFIKKNTETNTHGGAGVIVGWVF